MGKKAIWIFGMILAASLLWGCGQKELSPVFVAGTAGAEKLFDGDPETKWEVSDFSEAFVIFSFPEPVVPVGYTMAPGQEENSSPGGWMLFAANGTDAPEWVDKRWLTIDWVKDGGSGSYPISGVTDGYRHYMLVITETRGAEALELPEFTLEYRAA